MPAALLTAGLFWRWRRTGRFRFLAGAALAAGLGLYTYSTMSLFSVLMLGIAGPGFPPRNPRPLETGSDRRRHRPPADASHHL